MSVFDSAGSISNFHFNAGFKTLQIKHNEKTLTLCSGLKNPCKNKNVNITCTYRTFEDIYIHYVAGRNVALHYVVRRYITL